MKAPSPICRGGLECHGWVSRLIKERARGRQIFLMFDFDGTLISQAAHADPSRLSRRMRKALESLTRLPGIALGVLSDRPLEQLKRLVDLPAYLLAGSGGRQLHLDGEDRDDPYLESDHEVLKQLASLLRDLGDEYCGVWVESKPGCLAVHLRELSKKDQAAVLQKARGLTLTAPCDWVCQEVGATLEITTRKAWGKCKAAKLALARLGKGTIPFYAGAAANDEMVMMAVNQLEGTTVGVGRGSPEIAGHFEPLPSTLAQGLESLVDAWLSATPVSLAS